MKESQTSQYIFNLYHYLLNLRDSLEYVIDREHKKDMYNQRQVVLTKGMSDGSALGNFLKQNPEQGAKIKEKLEEFVKELYSEDSTILKLAGDDVRVDHSQHVKLFDYICGLSESVRDIVYAHIFNLQKQPADADEELNKLLLLDDKLYRPVFTMLAMRDFEKSFAEFQKVMAESQGKPTPQSNFIVQNEIIKYSQMIRFVHDHHHLTDNETMDVLDEVLAIIEMTEGRRDRRDGKSFKDLFDDINKKLNDLVAKAEAEWKPLYEKCFKQMVEASQKKKVEVA